VLTLGVLSLFFSFAAPVGLALGIIAWVMGQGDLTKMRRGDMDRDGQGITTGGWVCAMVGTVLSVILGLVIFWWFLVSIEERATPNRTYPPARNRPMPGQRF
jgi:hypothetical protein